jgi:hypothetical protein
LNLEHFFVYNFITPHITPRMPPALRGKVTDHKWNHVEPVEPIDRQPNTPSPG